MSEYERREQVANIRPLGQFGTPNPEAYLGKGAVERSMEDHPAGKGRDVKEKARLDPDEVVNLFRLLMLILGAVCCAIGAGWWINPALGLIVFGAMIWTVGALFIGKQTIVETVEQD